MKVNQNPVLPELKQSSAFSPQDGMNNFDEQEILRYDEQRSPLERISPEAYVNDIAGFWRLHETGLWTVALLCLIYLLLKILGA